MAKKRKQEANPSADRSELRRLLEAAKADYWDDGPRLALADWLEEHGGEADRARAEVVRLQLDHDAGGPWWGPPGILVPELVTVHEFGHQYFYGLIATDEHRWPFLDEGVNSYAEQDTLRAWRGPGSGASSSMSITRRR